MVLIYKREFKLGNLNKNPFDLLDIREISKQVPSSSYQIEPFNTQEKEAIINHATGQIKNFIQLAFWSGMRIGEIIALTWDDVNFKSEIVYVTKSKTLRGIIKSTKTNTGITEVELTPLALDALKAQYKLTGKLSTNAVFTNPATEQAWYSASKSK